MGTKIRRLLWLVFPLVLSVSARAEDFMIGGWTMFFTSHTANQCVIFENQKGDSGEYTLHYKVFEGRGGGAGKESGKFKVYHDEKGRVIVKLDEHRICFTPFDNKGQKAKTEGNMFDGEGTAMFPGSGDKPPKLGDAKIDGVDFHLLKGKHADPDKVDDLAN
ncbi:hypothetical protein OVA24_16290 [Luteolibacter sp. SL250]|uniref:hypothetical protein n=1 Tax=Luteolibacter sp. SL250 TaxID=2995170 RepID=UPI002271BF1D|nr:hypothetical protein [Luteolibacter sp. SL250]WAC18790.1 hypothetical protein OVA24_16290 [Luteolibacter sp. SL250]